MRAVVVRGHGAPDVLEIEDRPLPEPGPGEVRVRVEAVALNHLDLWVRRGVPGHAFPLPLVPGSDVAGVVDALGPGVSDLEPGSRVLLNPGVSCGICEACRRAREPLCRRYGILGETRDGGCAEAVVVPRFNVLPRPANLSAVEAAAMPLVFLTAWHMLVTRAGIEAGSRVLIHAAGSGVSSAAIQIARVHGARVMATAGADEKCDKAVELGAEVAVNYQREDFAEAARRWTGGRGVDVVLDHVGEATFGRSLRCLAKGGIYVTCGATSGFRLETDFRLVFFKSFSILGSTMGSSHELVRVLDLAAQGILRPVVDRTFTLDEVREAHRYLESRKGFGKVVLTVDVPKG